MNTLPSLRASSDIDGNSKADLVYTNEGFSTVGVLFGNGNGTFGAPQFIIRQGEVPMASPSPT